MGEGQSGAGSVRRRAFAAHGGGGWTCLAAADHSLLDFFQVCGRRSGGWPALLQAEVALATRSIAIVPLASFRDDTAPAIRRRAIDFDHEIETVRQAMRAPNQPPQKAATRLDAVMEAAVDGIIVIDADGHVQTYNKACERLFGYAAADVIGKNVKMLMPSPDHERHDNYLDNYKRTGVRKIIGIGREVTGKRKDGSTFPMDLSVAEVRQGDDHAFVGIIRDITERKRAEAELREREARLSTILDTAVDAIIVIDEAGKIESFSASAARLFGYELGEVRGENVKMLMPTPYREEHDSYIGRYLETGERRIIGIGRIVVGLRKDGTTFPMELSVGEVRFADRRMFTGFIRDVSERQKTEHRLHELQAQLIHVSRVNEMGAMASALAHELNQPLGAAMNYLNAVRRWLEQSEDAKGPRMLEGTQRAVAEVTRASQIIQRLRQFMAKGRTERSWERIGKLIEESAALALVGAGTKPVRIGLALSPGLPEVHVDRVQIQQVLTNLIRNAVEAMQESPKREINITGTAGAETLEISVADTGPGIAPEVAENLFKPFVTTKSTGMGVGLSICRSIIQNHGGDLRGETRPAGGTVFRFTLPLKPAEAKPNV
jgi:two-component system sensor kinase FixL